MMELVRIPMDQPLPSSAPPAERSRHYDRTLERIHNMLDGVDDWVAAMATVVCELHHAFAYYHWTGFYRVIGPTRLAVGPYQGGHGCLFIDFERGVCGAAATTRQTQLVADVHAFPGHIACSSTTRSEIVVPILGPTGRLLAVLDVDSDAPAVFTTVDQVALERLCADLGARFQPAFTAG